MSFFLGSWGMNRSAEQTNRPRTASRFTRFVCPVLRFIPHEPRKKDTHSLNIRNRNLHSKRYKQQLYFYRVENCRNAMILAKEHLNIPRMISPEDFASGSLDELSAMTYLSYFVKVDSPGYYDTLNWVCKQLRTTTITNLTVS